jgi:hypothetical protein
VEDAYEKIIPLMESFLARVAEPRSGGTPSNHAEEHGHHD